MSKLIALIATCLVVGCSSLGADSWEKSTLEVGIKSGMGCVETGKDSYPSFSGGIVIRPSKPIYGIPYQIGFDTMGYSDRTRKQDAGWLKLVGLYKNDNLSYLKGFYVGGGVSIGAVNKWFTDEMTTEKSEEIYSDMINRSEHHFSERWDSFPQDRRIWVNTKETGLFGEGLLGYEWYPNFLRSVKGLDGKSQDAYVPLRMFLELSVHQRLWTKQRGEMTNGPYIQMDLGIGF